MDAWIKTGSCRKRVQPIDDEPSTSTGISVSNPVINVSVTRTSIAKPEFTKKAKSGFRKYSPDYLKYGFVFSGTEEEPFPQCVICFDILANESMKPSKLERHLSTKHAQYKCKPIEFFKNKQKEFIMSKSIMNKISTGNQNKQATIASYELSLLIAKKGASHTVGEEIILPAAKIISEKLFNEKCTKLIDDIPLSNTTVKRRVDEMADSVKEILLTSLKQSDFFALQLDESTDVAGLANLLAFVRFECNGSIEEELLFCKSLPSKTTGEEIFKCLDNFITENDINWSKCVGVTTDGAAAMSGTFRGLIARVRAVAPLVKWTHCSLHREALAVKGLDGRLKETLDDAVKLVNYIKSRPKQSRIFAILCNEMGSDHSHLLLHCEVRWLSRGRVLTRLFELKDELRIFLLDDDCEKKSVAKFLELLNNELWLFRLAYLSDIFNFLNTLNLSLQGKDIHKFYVQDKIDAAIKKITRWQTKVDNNNFDSFSTMHDFMDFNELTVDEETATSVKENLSSLVSNLR